VSQGEARADEEEAYRRAVVDIIIRHLELMVEEIQGVARKYEPKDTLPSAHAPTATAPQPEALESLPWKNYPKGNGAWIFSNLDEARALTEALLKADKRTLIIGSYRYRLQGPSDAPDRFIARYPRKGA
jgi:hypothetical protein